MSSKPVGRQSHYSLERGGPIRKVKALVLVSGLLAALVSTQSSADELSEYRALAKSDDARSLEEAHLHGKARVLVVSSIEPNTLDVEGKELRVKRNPFGKGCFVYDPRTRFSGAERNLVWLVLNENTAYALNPPSKLVTPHLKWPHQDEVAVPPTGQVIEYVFKNIPVSPPKRKRRISSSAYSEGIRPPVPSQADHPFRRNPTTCSNLKPTTWSSSVGRVVGLARNHWSPWSGMP